MLKVWYMYCRSYNCQNQSSQVTVNRGCLPLLADLTPSPISRVNRVHHARHEFSDSSHAVSPHARNSPTWQNRLDYYNACPRPSLDCSRRSPGEYSPSKSAVGIATPTSQARPPYWHQCQSARKDPPPRVVIEGLE